MYNVKFYQVISPQADGSSRYGIEVTASPADRTRRTGFVPLDTDGPFILTKISACFSQEGSDGSSPGPKPGFVLPYGLEFRIWDEASGRQLFQADVNGIDDGFLPFSVFMAQQQIGQNIGDQTTQPALMSLRAYQLPEECEFPAGGILRVDVRPVIDMGTPAVEETITGTVYMSFIGYTHV